MAFDGIVTKKVVEELQTIINYKIDKIYQPDKNTIMLGLYGNFTNLTLLLCISSNNYRAHITTHTLKNPDLAPNFCMLLRKHILGYKITKIYTKSLERIIYIDIQNNDNIDKPINKTLIVELMGKHSNIILIYERGIIIDALRHTSVEENAQRDIYPTARYFQPITKKKNLLDTQNFEDFYTSLSQQYNESKTQVPADISKKIVDTFNGIGLSNIKSLIRKESNQNQYISEKLIAHQIYNEIFKLINTNNLTIQTKVSEKGVPNDYYLCIKNKKDEYSLNYALDDFYYKKEGNEIYTNYRNALLSRVMQLLKKYEKRLENIDSKLKECNNMEKYRLYGELITANLYRLPKYNVGEVLIENYYNENKLIKIKLDKKYLPQYNAKIFFKKYNKLKNALEIVSQQKQDTIDEIKYIESIIYELDNCSTIGDLDNVYAEIEESSIFKLKVLEKRKNRKQSKAKRMTSNKYVSFNPLKYNIEDYTIFVGRNNKENDYLTNKFAGKNDIWFHAKDIHGSHVIVRNTITNDLESIPENIILEAAKLAVSHSKAKNSSNIPVDYCYAKYVRKIPGNKPGLVTYKNYKTVYVEN